MDTLAFENNFFCSTPFASHCFQKRFQEVIESIIALNLKGLRQPRHVDLVAEFESIIALNLKGLRHRSASSIYPA